MVKKYKSKENKKCNHGRPIYKILLDNIESFLDRMHKQKDNSNTPYFFFTFLTQYTHDHLKISDELDDYFTESLKKFERKGYFDNTLLYINSDHGMRMHSYGRTEPGRVERYWPLLSVRLPKKLWNTKYHDALKENKDKLVSFYDQYQTLRHFLHLNANYSKEMDSSQFSENNPRVRYLRGISLFEDISKYRTCQNAMVPDNYCKCMEKLLVDEQDFTKNTKLSFLNAGNYILEKIEALTASQNNLCVPFEIEKINPVDEI